MCQYIVQAIWAYQGDDLDGVHTAILSRMGWYAGFDGTAIYPSIRTIANQTKFSISTVSRALKYFRDNKFLIVHRKSNKAKHRATTYRFNFSKINMPIPEGVRIKKQSTQPVDKSVNNTPPYGHRDRRAMVTETIGAMVTETNNRSLTNIINKDHMIGGQQDDLKYDSASTELVRQMLNADIDKKSISLWIAKFGAERVNSLWRELRHPKHDKVARIKNLGAYFRKVMESVDAHEPKH